jgi:ketosteroid isomerase-like protein
MIGALIAKNAVSKGMNSVMNGDLDALRSVFHQDASVVYPTKGTIAGQPAIVEFYRQFITVFPKVQAIVHVGTIENPFDLVGTNVLALSFEVHTTNRSGITFTQEGMMLIRLRRAKIMLLRYYFSDTVALAEAWRASE